MTTKTVETAQFDAFARRILKAYARRVGEGDVDGLESLAGMAREIDTAMRVAIVNLRAEPWHYSWNEIARVLGVSRQAARQRYGPPSAAA